MENLAGVQWVLKRDGSPQIGPAPTELVVRGLMAGKIPHDCLVQRVGDSTWTKILDVDVFHDAMAATVVQTRVQARKPSDRPPPKPPSPPQSAADTLITERPPLPEIPAASLEALGRAWHAPEWMVMLPGNDDMQGPMSLAEVKRLAVGPALDGAQVCRMRTFDWIAASEAFARAGDEPLLVPSEGRIPAATPATPAPPIAARAPGWTDPAYRVRHGGKVQGPTSLEQIVRARDAGRLDDDDEVASRERDDWRPLREVVRRPGRNDAHAPTMIVARRLGEEKLPGIALRRGHWGTWVVLAAVVLAFLYAVIVKLAG